MWAYHIEGGVEYMVPLTILFILNTALIVYALVLGVQGRRAPDYLPLVIGHVGGLALVWGVFSTVVGLFQIFRALSQMNEPPPLAMIMGGLKVGFITTSYGLIIFMVSMVAEMILRLLQNRRTQPR